MESAYVKLWASYESYFEPLSDAEVGRLVRAMISYRSTGTEPKFNGNERFVWPAIKRDIDINVAAQEELAQTRAESGRLGGLAKKANATAAKQSQQTLDELSKSSYGEGKGKGQGKGQGQGQGNIARSLSRELAETRAGAREDGCLLAESEGESEGKRNPFGWSDEKCRKVIEGDLRLGYELWPSLKRWLDEHPEIKAEIESKQRSGA